MGFSYDGKKETIQDFDFHAASGQKIALVGETGGGKSTILKLLFRFYDVQKGKIVIDDQDIRDITLHSLRQSLGVVPQDPALFNDSVMENVRYSRIDATDEEVIEACQGAAVHDKILTFTEGYQTKVGENGVKLSGGELQRIAIARVILKNPDIILLDEATSAVDTETEAHIQAALHKLTQGRTTITIAHRLSTVMDSDVIVVIKGGKIVEQGPPHALLEAKGKLSELWLKQIGIGPKPTEEDNSTVKVDNRSDTPRGSTDLGTNRLSEASVSSNKSLRPTAPEFVPRKGFVSRHQRGPAAKGGDAVDQADNGKAQQKRKLPAQSPIDGAISDSQWDTADSKQETATPIPAKKKRPNPAQRRRMNKSDPNGSTSKSYQHGEPADESFESRNMHQQHRRVSAPGRPLSSVTNMQEGGRAQRRRAQRQHQPKRQSRTSRSSSGTASGEGPGANASDNMQSSAPIVRLPTSVPPTDGEGATAPAASSVRFAPGF